MNKAAALIICLSMMMLASCGSKADSASSQQAAVNTTLTSQESSADETVTDKQADDDNDDDDTNELDMTSAETVFDSLTLDEKIGQLFIVAPETLNGEVDRYDRAESYDKSIGNNLKSYPVGGIIHFSENIIDPEQIKKFNSDLQSASRIPLFIAVDEEGGSITRIASNDSFDVKDFPDMYDIGATNDTDKAEEVGQTIGAYLKEYGFNTDFAPVADVFTNPYNTVIGTRSFSSDAITVSEMVSGCIDGFHKSGTICTLKHFPGHGDTDSDTHSGYVSVSKSWEELEKCELIPFKDNLEKTDMIMTAHITLPNVTGGTLPASISKEILTDRLRDELGYDGVIITDSMSMGAIALNYQPGDAAVKAIDAGADIILMPGSIKSSFEAVKAALDDGTLTIGQIDKSVMRVLKLKEKYGILK